MDLSQLSHYSNTTAVRVVLAIIGVRTNGLVKPHHKEGFATAARATSAGTDILISVWCHSNQLLSLLHVMIARGEKHDNLTTAVLVQLCKSHALRGPNEGSLDLSLYSSVFSQWRGIMWTSPAGHSHPRYGRITAEAQNYVTRLVPSTRSATRSCGGGTSGVNRRGRIHDEGRGMARRAV